MKTVIFDMDGTLSDSSHRQHYLEQHKKDWNAFYAAAKDDPPQVGITTLAKYFYNDPEFTVIIITGRPEKYRQLTIDWLQQHNVQFDQLHMRPNDDFRSDFLVKEQIYLSLHHDGFEVIMAIDDRKQVVDMWRRWNILTLHCAEGDF